MTQKNIAATATATIAKIDKISEADNKEHNIKNTESKNEELIN